MANLQLALEKQWFDLTKSGVKTEDYREITQYWLKRFTGFYLTSKRLIASNETLYEMMSTDKDFILSHLQFKKYDLNIMTLGYPKLIYSESILKLEHKGIEVRTGNPDWGAKPNRLYFVIMHGAFL